MKIVICSSIDFSQKLAEVKKELEKKKHEIEIPLYAKKIINGEVSMTDYLKEKEKNGDLELRKKSKEDLIKRHFNNIKTCDAILVLNYDKKGIKNYVGGNTFLEMGFAYVLNKKIFLLNPVPELNYKDEIEAMKPIILNGDLDLIK